jgi:RNA polymerase sigma-70 factor (ECF subfamily)
MSEVVESQLRELLARSEIDRATEVAIRAFGPELLGWLRSILPTDDDAQDAFSRTSEELWRSLAKFDGRCSVRTWCYTIARRVAVKIRAQPRHTREVLVSTVPSVVGAVTHVLDTMKMAQQRAVDVYAQIRAELSEEEQTLLVLRVDRGLSWKDIAQVLADEAETDGDIQRRAAQLRKQFERVKAHLKKLAAERL